MKNKLDTKITSHIQLFDIKTSNSWFFYHIGTWGEDQMNLTL